jgi:hypothetical protein
MLLRSRLSREQPVPACTPGPAGDALVVDTFGMNDRAWLDAAGHPRTAKAHFIERFTRPELAKLVCNENQDDNNLDVQHLVGKYLLGFLDHSIEAPGKMQVGPVELSPEHHRDVVFGFLGAIHFAHASHQAHGAFAIRGHLLFGGDRSVTRNDGLEVEL